MQRGVFIVDDVWVIQRLELGWLCEIEGKPRFVGTMQIVPGSTVPKDGERGPLTITPAAMKDLGVWRARCA